VSLIVRLARENSSLGCDRIAGELTNLCHKVSDQTVATFSAVLFRIQLETRRVILAGITRHPTE
jgi:hypothetical protein